MNEMDRLIDVLDSLRDDKNFGSDDAQKKHIIECTECKEKCSFIKRGFKKYPYVLCFNLLDVLFLIALFVLTATNVLS